MAGDPGAWEEIIVPGVFDARLPAVLPVHGPDGAVIEGAVARVTRDDRGLAVTIVMPGHDLVAARIPDLLTSDPGEETST